MTDAALRSRRLVRAPSWLCRHGLGRLLGSRLLMLEHVGRTTGRARHVVLEVVGHPRPGRYLVVSGFEKRAQWYRSVSTEPRVHLSVGRRQRVPPGQLCSARDEADAALRRSSRS